LFKRDFVARVVIGAEKDSKRSEFRV